MERYNASTMLSEGVKTIPNYLLKSPARIVKPGFNGFRTPAVFRLMPGVNPENPREFDASVLDDGAPGEWIRSFASVQYALGKGVSFVLQEDAGDRGWPQHSPYMIVRRALSDLAKNPNTPMYVANMVNGNSKEKPFPDCKIQAAVAVASYHRGDQDWQPRFDQLDVLLLGQGVAMMTLDVVGVQCSTIDNVFDPTSPDKGAFIVMWNKEEVIEPPGISKELIRYQKGSFGYGIAVSPVFPRIGSMYDGVGASLLESEVAAYKSVMRPWNNVIDYKSYDEQASLMCEYSPAAPLVYAWGDTHPEWLTNSVKLRANNEPRIGGPAPVQGYSVSQGYGASPQKRDMYQPPQQEAMMRPKLGTGRPVQEVQDDEDEAPWAGPDAPIEEQMSPQDWHKRAVKRTMAAMGKKGEDDPM